MAEPQSSLPPGLPPKELGARRSKLAWRVLLIANLALGAYIFTRPRKKDSGGLKHKKALETEVNERKSEEEAPLPPTETTLIDEMTIPDPPPAMERPVKVRKPIPEDQQIELFKWMLEEERKVKPRDPQEKKRNNEDKATLKRFIRAESIPRFE